MPADVSRRRLAERPTMMKRAAVAEALEGMVRVPLLKELQVKTKPIRLAGFVRDSVENFIDDMVCG